MSDDDNSWVLDSLVCFLNGPIWNAPLQSFIEEKSLVFEPIDPHKEEYNAIFDEFKTLVDFMLGNFMEDIGISPEQFHNACSEGSQHISFNNRLFEQIWAANDFDMFTRMMTQKNVELQLEALDLIEKKYGITPQIFIPKRHSNRSQAHSDELESASSSTRIVLISRNHKETENIDNQVSIQERTIENKEIENDPKCSVDIKNKNKIIGEMEANIMVEVARKFSEDKSDIASSDKIQELIEQKPALENKLKEALVAPPLDKETSGLEKSEQFTSKISNAQEIDEFELKKRQQYLRSQRDKLVALKKEARQKQLATDLNNTKLKQRPKSAKAAEAVLIGAKPTKSVETDQLEIRKTLAKRLKAEVVDKK